MKRDINVLQNQRTEKRFYFVIKVIDETILGNRWLYINLQNFSIFCRMLKNHNLTNDLIFFNSPTILFYDQFLSFTGIFPKL